jgi:DNA primase
MTGRIRDEDVAAVRERTRIDEVVSEFVTLKPAGGGSLKGLCPFHDERSPSFHVTPSKGLYHCFGCQAGGDAITFLMELQGLSFAEAVERLAGRAGIVLRYVEGGTAPQRDPGRRARLVAANEAAAAWYREQLAGPAGAPARDLLAARGFGPDALDRFAVGYAPGGWDGLSKRLGALGFDQAVLQAAGLSVPGSRGVYDRFRDRIMWPIRDLTGDVIGFGGRRLADAADSPKYLNTPETALYRKSTVLYGIDLARREIARTQEVVVVEGYTDVMACHLAGVGNAVATCGTAFGADHVGVLRRILLDDGRAGVVFTFDGDAAGQRAALRAYGTDAKFLASTYVAVEPAGLDPADLRLQQGDQAVRDLVARRVPLFEFALRAAVAGIDIGTAEGRSAGARAAAPILAGIKDSVVREDYIRTVAGWLGLPERSVAAQLAGPGRPARADQPRAPAAQAPPGLERDALRAVLQAPAEAGQWLHAVEPSAFEVPVYREIFEVVAAVGPPAPDEAEPVWTARLLAALPAGTAAALTRALAVEPLPVSSAAAQDVGRYTVSLLARLLDRDAAGRQDALAAQLSRPDARADEVLRRGLQEQYRALGDLRAQLQPAIRAEAVS